jgi:hypothetical protein
LTCLRTHTIQLPGTLKRGGDMSGQQAKSLPILLVKAEIIAE